MSSKMAGAKYQKGTRSRTVQKNEKSKHKNIKMVRAVKHMQFWKLKTRQVQNSWRSQTFEEVKKLTNLKMADGRRKCQHSTSHTFQNKLKHQHDRRSQKKHKKHAIHQDDGRLQKSEPFSNLKSAEPSKKQMVSEKSKIQEAQHVGT